LRAGRAGRPTLRDRAVVIAAVTILVAIVGGVGLLAVAMHLYPGGNDIDLTMSGHSFWFNFLCDICADVAVCGRPNPRGAAFARAGMLAFAIALGLFWLILPEPFRQRRRLAAVIRIGGSVSAIGVFTVPLVGGWLHVAAIFAASVPALVAGVLGIVGTFTYSRASLRTVIPCATLAAIAIDAVLYAQSYMVQPRVVHPTLPVFQRIASLLALLWMSGAAIVVLQGRTRRPS
jgi:hypothetical protein